MAADQPIRVFIVDDHDLLRRGLIVSLQARSDIELVGEAEDGDEAIQRIGQLDTKPDVVLMDLFMPTMNGVTAIRHLHQDYPQIQCIVLTSYIDEALVKEVLNAGAISYLIKNTSVEAMAEAIHDAMAGKSTLAPEAVQALVNASHQPTQESFGLTEREHEVLQLMANGLSNADIADRLTLSISTVKKHVSQILEKMQTSSRTEAVAVAFRLKMVTANAAQATR